MNGNQEKSGRDLAQRFPFARDCAAVVSACAHAVHPHYMLSAPPPCSVGFAEISKVRSSACFLPITRPAVRSPLGAFQLSAARRRLPGISRHDRRLTGSVGKLSHRDRASFRPRPKLKVVWCSSESVDTQKMRLLIPELRQQVHSGDSHSAVRSCLVWHIRCFHHPCSFDAKYLALRQCPKPSHLPIPRFPVLPPATRFGWNALEFCEETRSSAYP